MPLWKLLKSCLNFPSSIKSYLAFPGPLKAGREPGVSFLLFSQCFMSILVMPLLLNAQFLRVHEPAIYSFNKALRGTRLSSPYSCLA